MRCQRAPRACRAVPAARAQPAAAAVWRSRAVGVAFVGHTAARCPPSLQLRQALRSVSLKDSSARSKHDRGAILGATTEAGVVRPHPVACCMLHVAPRGDPDQSATVKTAVVRRRAHERSRACALRMCAAFLFGQASVHAHEGVNPACVCTRHCD